tara:strand:+ start:332 stop:514 length:183 start_codon:yes stop_codon:yes gene_type:complete
MDYISIGALALSLGNAIVVVIHELHIKRCQSILCSSECSKTPPPTPMITKEPDYRSMSHC